MSEQDPFDDPELNTFALLVLGEAFVLACLVRVGWEVGGLVWQALH